jgi:colicin import membrane protein
VTTTIAEYSQTEAALAELRSRYADVVYDVSTGKGMTEAKMARAVIRDYRVSLEKKRVEIKAPALERCRQIDSEAKRITAELSALEDPIDTTIKIAEEAKERAKAALEQAERERIAALNARFNEIKALPLTAVGATADEILAQIEEAELIDPATFPEDMQPAAAYEKRLAISALRAALDKRRADDAEAEKIKADRAELDRLRADADALRIENDRLAQVERDRLAAEQQAEQARIDAERAEARRIEDEARAAAADKLRQEQAKAAAERAKLEADKKAAAKREREQAIANASLLSAASGAVELLQQEGFGDHIVTQTLAAAVSREEPMRAVA